MMRLESKKRSLLKQSIIKILPQAEIYLFGSRTDDTRKGGDIDLLILGDRTLTLSEQSDIRFEFERHFGEQKLDLVSMRHQDEDPFKTLILNEAIPL